MTVSLISHLREVEAAGKDEALLVLSLGFPAAKSIVQRSCTLQDALPAIWAHCQEMVIASEGEPRTLNQLRRCLRGPRSIPIASALKPLSVFALLDDALAFLERRCPHDVLELRRQRLRSGSWLTSDGTRVPA
ncbi:MAG TPA: hypothetical protein VIV60_13670 [Polyangiaceae bacterium]